MSRIEDIRARLDAATPGPWRIEKIVGDGPPADRGGWIHNGREGSAEYAVAVTLPYSPKMVEDTALIARAPTDLLDLLDATETARALLEDVGVDDLCSGLAITEYGCAGCPAHDLRAALARLDAS